MMSNLWYYAANIENLDCPDVDELDEFHELTHLVKEQAIYNPEIEECIRCQSPIDSHSVFCPKCYDYLDERGYFES